MIDAHPDIAPEVGSSCCDDRSRVQRRNDFCESFVKASFNICTLARTLSARSARADSSQRDERYQQGQWDDASHDEQF